MIASAKMKHVFVIKGDAAFVISWCFGLVTNFNMRLQYICIIGFNIIADRSAVLPVQPAFRIRVCFNKI